MTTNDRPAGDRVPRDRYGRPLIVPPGGGKPKPYTRASTVAAAVTDQTGLTRWKIGRAAHHISARADLRALVQSANGDDGQLRKVVAQIDELDREASNVGTALHAFAESVDLGRLAVEDVQPEWRDDIAAYRQAMHAAGYTVVAAEQFVVEDQIEAAGTYDRLLLTPDGRLVIADLKTGASAARYPHGTAVQMAVYARGALYDPDTATRTTIPGIDTKRGVLVHVPQGKAECTLIDLDLEQGWWGAMLATDVRNWRKQKVKA